MCDGWSNVSLEECKLRCYENKVPSGCSMLAHKSCAYVVWDDNPQFQPGSCQLADDSCEMETASSTAELWGPIGKKENDNDF